MNESLETFAGAAPPFATLTPDAILGAIDSVGFYSDGRLLALNSYENRVYQVGVETADGQSSLLVAKFYRPQRWTAEQVEEEHAYTTELAAAELPVVAPLELAGRTLHMHGDFLFAVYPRQGGRPPEFGQEGTLAWMGRLLGRIHAVAARSAFRVRPALDIATFGEEPLAYLRQCPLLAPELASVYLGLVEQALAGVRRCFERAGPQPSLRLHGDCHAGNVLWTDDGPHFVDFDDSRSGPAIQDLWMLLDGSPENMAQQLQTVLAGYRQFADFDERQLHLIEALRTLRLIHYAAWLARRWHDPAFPAAFPWFDSPRYWQERILELREQIALMDEAPLAL